MVERNCGEVLFDGSDDEKWNINHYMDNCTGFYIKFNNIKGGITPLSSNLKKLNNYLVDEQGVFSTYSDDIFYININKSNLTTENLDGLKLLLKNNTIIFVYPLKNPVYESLNMDSTINTYLDTTHISTNSTIPANLKVIVDRVANRAKEFSELAKETPTIENISLARMWTNLMRESILKDEFQDNIDNITEIAEMTLDRKTASANIDVYIKSENMLSMNLSTNSITFDDFSGIEDMTKENAVNISINSSLPYNLNAYLAIEIQNSDKSNTMNKDILSIKDNSEVNYQTFSSANNKVVLKSNCSSGNDRQHAINLKLNGGIAHEKDVYKTTIKFEAEQQ